MQRARIIAIVALGALVGTAALFAAWALDVRAHSDEVLPNVTVAGQRTRGLDATELSALVDEVAESFAEAVIEVRTPSGDFEATIAELGVSVDMARTEAATMAAGRQGNPVRRILDWARSFVRTEEIGVAVAVEREVLDKVVAERDPTRRLPTEPFFEVVDGRLEVRDGIDGLGLDPQVLADRLRRADPTVGRIVVELTPSALPPRFSSDDARALARQAEALAADGFEVEAASTTATVPPEMFLGWIQTVDADGELVLTTRAEADILGGLIEVLGAAGTPPKGTGLRVDDGVVNLVAPEPGTLCCAPEAVDIVTEALRSGATAATGLPMTDVAPPDDEAEVRALGINEMVSTFTTGHAAGQARVRNIQRMADTIRGTIIRPGETFSINGIVGLRTTAKGYVSAGIIGADGRLDNDVGGGVSQFATTMFNAAFFAGVDITEYFMHTLYFSRYPYGREATVSFPAPDLKWRNTTPYGILVWPTYTPTSITVSLYSTRHITAEQTAQTTEVYAPRFIPEELRPGAQPTPTTSADSNAPTTTTQPPEALMCTRVFTERTRIYLDGRTVTDTFRANYSPAEGVLC